MISKALLLSLILPTFALAEGPIALEQWPERSEDCMYTGTSDYNGKLQVRTLYSRGSEAIKVHTLVDFNAGMMGINKTFRFDETAFFDAKTGAFTRVERNFREINDGWTSTDYLNKWDIIAIDWKANRLTNWRMMGTSEKKFAASFPGFAKYWPATQFGRPWAADFFPAKPIETPELGLTNMPKNLVPGLALSFFLPRIANPAKDKSFSILGTTEPKEGKERALVAPIQVAYQDQGAMRVIQSRVVLGQLQSPPGKPSTVYVQNGQIQKIDFILQHPKSGTVEGSIQLQSCR